MEYLIVQPVNKTQSAVLKEFLKKNKIDFKDKKETKIRPEQETDGDISEYFGIWKDEKITLASIRKKAWRKIKL